MRIVLAGSGRMGQRIVDQVEQSDRFSIAGVWRRGSALEPLLSQADAIVDFSLPEGTLALLSALKNEPLPLVCGVSGLTESQMSALTEYSALAPVVYDRNMSLGVAVLERAVADAAKALGAEFDVRIEETHHVNKKDAPSGTALKLAEAMTKAAAQAGLPDYDEQRLKYDVERKGDVVGEHAVVFSSSNEVLTFSHHAVNRDLFAQGALRAAEWVIGQSTGLYTMQHVLRPASGK